MNYSNNNLHLPSAQQGPIHMGQGEYLVFHQGNQRVSKELFERVYPILNSYSTSALIEHPEKAATRYHDLKSRVKQIDPTLEIAFVPRTLCELVFLRKCIKEDLKQNRLCRYEGHNNHFTLEKYTHLFETGYENYLEEKELYQKNRKCWHLTSFEESFDQGHPAVKEIAYRLNKAMCKTFNPKEEGFTHPELSTFAQKEMQFLQKFHEANQDNRQFYNCSYPGPSTNFCYDTERGGIKFMGITSEEDYRLLQNCIGLECSELARNSVLLYRGSSFFSDRPISKNKPYILSYGAGVFAGSVFDPGATAFYYMRKQDWAYAQAIAYDQFKDSPFYYPPSNFITQLLSHGETFHPRTKIWQGSKLQGDTGGLGFISDETSYAEKLRTSMSKDELVNLYEKYKSQAIQLK